MKKYFILLAAIGLVIGLVIALIIRPSLDKIIEEAVSDGVITVEEAQKINKAFDEAGIDDCSERVDYVLSFMDENDSEAVRQALGCITPPQLPVNVFVFLDNTSSMEGYIRASDASSFTRVMNGINDYYAKNDIIPDAFYTEAKKQDGQKVTNIVSVDFAELRSDIVAHKLNQFTDSYQLNNFFDEVRTRLLPDSASKSICFFITDGIPSGTNEEINPPGKRLKLEERKFNISRKDELKSRIADALRPLGKAGGFGAAVFQFFAPYKGEYWKYNNDHNTVLNDQIRPFYVFAVGQEDLLKAFLEQVEAGLNSFAPENKVSFLPGNGQFIPHNPEYLEKKEGKVNEFFFNAKQINIDEDKEESLATLYFKMDELPCYLRDTAMLDDIVRIEVENVDVSKIIKVDRIDFKVKAREEATQKVHVVVKDSLPHWVELSNSPDDSGLSPQNLEELKKTFNLDIVLQGIKQGIFNKGGERNAIDATFVLDSNSPND